MVNRDDSVRITRVIPTLRGEGNFHSVSGVAYVSVLTNYPIESYSNFQSGSSGCFKSHSGRRLRTSGISSKLYSGGGEVVVHSKVQASHGSSPAILPFRADQIMLMLKIMAPILSIIAPILGSILGNSHHH